MMLEYCKNNRSRLSFIAITFFTLMFIQVKYSYSFGNNKEDTAITGTWTGMLIIKKGQGLKQEHCHYKVTTVISQSNDYIKSWQGTRVDCAGPICQRCNGKMEFSNQKMPVPLIEYRCQDGYIKSNWHRGQTPDKCHKLEKIVRVRMLIPNIDNPSSRVIASIEGKDGNLYGEGNLGLHAQYAFFLNRKF